MSRLLRSLGDERLDLLAERFLEMRAAAGASVGNYGLYTQAARALADALEFGPPDNDLCRCGGAGCQAPDCNNPEVR